MAGLNKDALQIVRGLSLLSSAVLTLGAAWLFLWFASDYATMNDAMQHIPAVLWNMVISMPLGALAFLLSWGIFAYAQVSLLRSGAVQTQEPAEDQP